MALSEINSKNYQRIFEFKLSYNAERLAAFDTDIFLHDSEKDKMENEDYYSNKKKVENLQQPYQRIFTHEEIQKIVVAYQSGKASYELSAKFNCSKATVVNLLKQQGVTIREKMVELGQKSIR